MDPNNNRDDRIYKPGDAAPKGYINWHCWAQVQTQSGLTQLECTECGRWRFPQELEDHLEQEGLVPKCKGGCKNEYRIS